MGGSKPWNPERQMQGAEVYAALRAAHPELPHASVRLLGSGWDNMVWTLVPTDTDREPMLLRVATRDMGDATQRRERVVLPLVVDLPVATPELLQAGEPLPGVPGCWMLLRPVPGQEWMRALAVDGQAARLATPEGLADLLAALHSPARAAGAKGVPREPLERADTARVRDALRRVLEAGLEVPEAAIERVLRAWGDLGTQTTHVLCHADLHLRHLMVRGPATAREVCGLIDWGDACVGPPSADLGIAWSSFSPGDRARFVARYCLRAPLGEALWAAARRYAIFSALALMHAASDQGDAEALRGAREGLGRALQPPI